MLLLIKIIIIIIIIIPQQPKSNNKNKLLAVGLYRCLLRFLLVVPSWWYDGGTAEERDQTHATKELIFIYCNGPVATLFCSLNVIPNFV